MRKKQAYVILTFARTTDAMAMERKCNAQNLPGRMIPVPREISAGCGLAWRIPAEAAEEAMPVIRDLGIPIERETVLEM